MSETAVEVVHRFRKNATEEVRAGLTTFKGHELVDLRVCGGKAERWAPRVRELTVEDFRSGGSGERESPGEGAGDYAKVARFCGGSGGER